MKHLKTYSSMKRVSERHYKLFESVNLPSEEELRECGLYDITDDGTEIDVKQIKDYYFIKFKTKDVELTETINKIEGMLDMKVFKIEDGLICIPIQRLDEIIEMTKEFFDPILNKLEQKGDYFISNRIKYFKKDLKNGLLWVSYDKIWSVLKLKYNLDHHEILAIIMDLMGEHFKLGSLTPFKHVYKLVSLTPTSVNNF